MSIPEVNDVIRFEAYKPEESDSAVFEISWSQTLRTKSATYYVVKAKNTTKSNADTLLYVQDRFYKDPSSPDYIGNIPGIQMEGAEWVLPITDRFQYGQKNAQGEKRWLVLHDKNNKPYQHRFMVTTIQGNAAEWAQKLAGSFGAGELAENVHKLGSSFVGDYLKTF